MTLETATHFTDDPFATVMRDGNARITLFYGGDPVAHLVAGCAFVKWGVKDTRHVAEPLVSVVEKFLRAYAWFYEHDVARIIADRNYIQQLAIR